MPSITKFTKENPQCEVIRLQWLDISNVLKTRNTTLRYFSETVAGKGSFTGSAVDAMMPLNQNLTKWMWPTLCDRSEIIPDMSSLRLVQTDPLGLKNNATVMCTVQDPKEGFAYDTRTVLNTVVSKAESKGLSFLVGYEIECMFLSEDYQSPAKAPARGDSMAHAFRSPYFTIWNQIQSALKAANVLVDQFHGEYGGTQFEMSLAPLPPIQAIEAMIYAKETIKDIAYQQGVRATFFPTPGFGFNGLHTHLSAHPKPGVQFSEDQFTAGLLSHLPALSAFAMANIDSYARVVDGFGVQGTWVAFGTENRETPIRKIKRSHWEMRSVDGTSNPYLYVAAAIVAGLDGEELTHKNLCDGERPSKMDESTLKAYGIITKMPPTLIDALAALRGDGEFFRGRLGKRMVDLYLEIKEYEEEKWGEMDVQERKTWAMEYF